MSIQDEARMDEAIDLTSEHDRPDLLSQFPQLTMLHDQERAELAFSILVRAPPLEWFTRADIPVYIANQVCLRCES